MCVCVCWGKLVTKSLIFFKLLLFSSSLSLSLSVYLFHSDSQSLSLSVCLSVCLSVSPSLLHFSFAC